MKEYINRIIHGNCVDVMKTLPDNSIDLVVTSPPYDNLRDYEGYSFDFESIADELYRIVKDGGVVVWIVNDETKKGDESGTSFRQALYFKEIGFNLHDTMIWHKPNSFNFGSNACYRQSFEYMFVFAKGKIKTVNLIKDAPTKMAGKTAKGARKHRDGGRDTDVPDFIVPDMKRRDNVWSYLAGGIYTTKDTFAFDHPAMFPEALAHDHIITWSNKKDIVLDPMCGAGTTCKMAKELGRKFIGIDISKKYCDIAQRRVDSTLMKTTLDEYNNALRGEEP